MDYFVIGYDVTDAARLQRIHRVMCRFAIPLEYSVFLLVGSVAQKGKCLVELANLINVKKDDIRCYTLPIRGLQKRLGRANLPDGIQWTGLPSVIE